MPVLHSTAEMVKTIRVLRRKRSYLSGVITSRPTIRASTTVAIAILAICPSNRMVDTVPEASP